MDLYDLAKHVRDDGLIPGCAKEPVDRIMSLIDGQVVVAEVHSPSRAAAKGLHIYFPRLRVAGHGQSLKSGNYDFPKSRKTDGNPPMVVYAPNHDQLPLQAMDFETAEPLPAADWPSPATPDLRFIQDTNWSRFLERYYHPVADNHILKGELGGALFYPETVGGGACVNAVDRITVPVGATVYLSGAGSSDADMPGLPTAPGLPPTPYFSPLYWFWDMNATIGCSGDCIQPATVPPGSDAGLASNDNMDQDQSFGNTTWDEKDAAGPQATRKCEAAGEFIVTLHAWDDNHLFASHDTIPSAAYVHPQTDSQQSIIDCVPPPVTWLCDQPPETIWTGQQVLLFCTLKSATGGGVPNFPVTVSTSPGLPALGPNSFFSPQLLAVGRSSSTPPAGATSAWRTDSSGSVALSFVPTAAASGQITLAAPSGPTQSISLNIKVPPAVTEVAMAGPSGGSVTVNGTGTIAVQPRNNGVPVGGVAVSLDSINGNIRFTSGTPYAQGLSTQVTTDSTGVAQATFQARYTGSERVIASVGKAAGGVAFTISGPAPAAPTAIAVLSAPALVDAGSPASLKIVTLYQNNVFARASVTAQALQGNVTFAGSTTPGTARQTTGTDGTATFTFTTGDPTPIQIKLTVDGTAVTTTVPVAVRLPAR